MVKKCYSLSKRRLLSPFSFSYFSFLTFPSIIICSCVTDLIFSFKFQDKYSLVLLAVGLLKPIYDNRRHASDVLKSFHLNKSWKEEEEEEDVPKVGMRIKFIKREWISSLIKFKIWIKIMKTNDNSCCTPSDIRALSTEVQKCSLIMN